MKVTDVEIVVEIEAKVDEACRLAADAMIRKARKMEPIPAFSYCRPELHKRQRSSFLAHAMEQAWGEVRSSFGLPRGLAE